MAPQECTAEDARVDAILRDGGNHLRAGLVEREGALTRGECAHDGAHDVANLWHDDDAVMHSGQHLIERDGELDGAPKPPSPARHGCVRDLGEELRDGLGIQVLGIGPERLHGGG